MEFTIKTEGKEYNLKESVELFALSICEDIADGKKRTEEIEKKCKILDSLSNAMSAIKI